MKCTYVIREDVKMKIPEHIKSKLLELVKNYMKKFKKAKTFEDILPLIVKKINFEHVLEVSEILNISIPATYVLLSIYAIELFKEIQKHT